MPCGVATASFPLYNQNEGTMSFRLHAPWLEGGRNKYAGKPLFVLGGASSMGQYGKRPNLACSNPSDRY